MKAARHNYMGHYAERVLAACWIQPMGEMDNDLTRILYSNFCEARYSVKIHSEPQRVKQEENRKYSPPQQARNLSKKLK